MPHVLIIEDDLTFSKILNNYLSRNGYETTVVHQVQTAIEAMTIQLPDIVLLDYRLPDGTGFDVLSYVSKQQLSLPIVMMTSFHDIKTAVQSIKKGAHDYITKPINQEELLMLLQNINTNSGEKETVTPPETNNFVKGNSTAALRLHEYIHLVAATDMSVLINGESGTGKEHVARALHNGSKRAHQPFIAVDCGALSAELAASDLFGHIKGAFTGALNNKKGVFELANGGTVFLDEVGNLSYDVQVKLLRAIQEREIVPIGSHKSVKVNVRLITATNEDFKTAISQGNFREDLYHRLNEFKIKIPSLAERLDDLDEFVQYFIARANKELNKQVIDIDASVRKLFRKYHWPGNIRELKNIIKRAVLLTSNNYITLEHLPEEMELAVWEHAQQPSNTELDLKAVQEQTEKALIVKTLAETKYNKSRAAKLLNIDRTTLYNKMAKYGIED